MQWGEAHIIGNIRKYTREAEAEMRKAMMAKIVSGLAAVIEKEGV